MRLYDINFPDLFAVLIWIAGVVVAKSGWSTFFAVICPPWAAYVFIEHVFKLLGVL